MDDMSCLWIHTIFLTAFLKDLAVKRTVTVVQQVTISHDARPVFVTRCDMTDVMISNVSMEDVRLSPGKDHLTFQIFPDPSDFERCCKLKDRLPSIVVEATEGEVESGELRWPPEEFIVSEEEDEKRDEEVQNAQMHETPH